MTMVQTAAPAAAPTREVLVARLRGVTFWILWLFILSIPSTAMLLVSEGVGSIARLVGALAVPPAVLALLVGGRRHRLLDVHLLLAALTTWAVASLWWTVDLGASVETAMTVVQLLVLVLLVWEFGSTPRRFRQLLGAFVLGGWVAALQLASSAIRGDQILDGRFTAGGYNPNDLAQVLLICIPVAWYLGLRAERRFTRWVAWGFLPLGAVTVLLTGSRMAAVVLPVALLMVPLTLGPLDRRSQFGLILAVLGVAVASALVIPPDTLDRLGSVATEVDGGDLNGRTSLWASATDIMEDHAVTGVGVGALPKAIQRDTGVWLGAHNGFLSVGAELGVVGLTLFLLVLLGTVVRSAGVGRPERALALAVLVVTVLTLLPSHTEYEKPTWLVLAVALAPAQALMESRPRPRAAVTRPASPRAARGAAANGHPGGA